MKIVWTIVLATALLGCSHRQKEADEPIMIAGDKELATADTSEAGRERMMAWADSISDITGIAYGPYFYDPSWTISYSEDARTLLYYPRDSVAKHFIIPESIEAIEERAFQCNKYLTEITIPKNVREIGTSSFYACESLRKATIQGRISSIPWRSFESCDRLMTVDLPESIKIIGGLAFAGCNQLRSFIVRNTEPPHFEFEDDPDGFGTMGAFADTDLSHCSLYVPKTSVEAYRQSFGWRNFAQIKSL